MDKYEWVEIMEPDSHKIVYANPTTGVMRFTPPPEGEPYKPMSVDQWWELFDPSSDSYYYHNPHNGVTVWERPENADIVSLTLMQNNSNNVEESTDFIDKSTSLGNLNLTSVTSNTNSVIDSEHHQNVSVLLADDSKVQSMTDNTPKENRKNSDAFRVPLETLSPLCVEYEGQRFSSFSDNSVLEPRTGNPTVSILDPVPEPVDETPQAAVNTRDRSGSHGKLKSLRPSSDTTNIMSEDERKRLESFLVISMKDVESTAVPGNPKRSKSEKGKLKNSTNAGSDSSYNTIDGSMMGKSKPHNRSQSHGVPPAPIPPHIHHTGGMSRSVSLQVQPGKSLENFGEYSTHKSGFFNRKKVTIANMLSFTKEPIKRPMILQRDKELRKESLNLFKHVLEYMGDRKSKVKVKDPDQIALQIVCKCWEKKGLRDELYVQLCRQTTSNPKKLSLKRGWQLLTICLTVFPPSIKFQVYLEGYLWRNTEPSKLNHGIPVESYAKFCHKQVEKMTRTGAKKGLQKPTLEEIQQAKEAPFNPSPFGSSLEEVLELQNEKYPDLELPWVMVELCDTVLRLRGPYTQGIFRIPGDIDAVNALKVHIDKHRPVPDSCDDPHIPASLLKLWFRELEDPLIPENYYQSCVDNFNNVGNALSLVDSLPKLNKEVFLYIIKFLQQFTTAESSQHTKMGVDNIAMVWAPNFLRCPSDDHVLIFENTRKEMAFVRLILTHINKPED